MILRMRSFCLHSKVSHIRASSHLSFLLHRYEIRTAIAVVRTFRGSSKKNLVLKVLHIRHIHWLHYWEKFVSFWAEKALFVEVFMIRACGSGLRNVCLTVLKDMRTFLRCL